MDAKDFFKTMYESKEDNTFLLIWRLKDNHSFWFDSWKKAAEFVINHPKENLYFQIALSGEDYGKKFRCTATEERPVVALPCVFADIDIAHDVHKKGNLPPTLDDAMSLAKGYGLDPTLVVHSGHGLQVYWIFKELWELDSAEERKKAATLLRRFKAFLQLKASEKGWTVDAVQDLARIFRPPGSWNMKNGNAKEVKVLEYHKELHYNPEDIAEFLDELNIKDPGVVGSSSGSGNTKEIQEQAKLLALNENANPPADKFMQLIDIFGPQFQTSWDNTRKDINDTSPSGYDMCLAALAAQGGWTDQEITDLMIAHRRERGHDLKLDRPDYYARTILNARRRPDVSAIISQAKEPGKASIIFDNINVFAQLSKAELGKARSQIKEVLGRKFSIRDFNAAIKEAKFRKSRCTENETGLPQIVINNRQLRDKETDATNALVAANNPPEIFVRAGYLCRIVTDENGKPFIEKITENILRRFLTLCAQFVCNTQDGTKNISPPKEICQMIMAAGKWKFPALRGLIEIPTLRADGTILDEPGYDPATKLYYNAAHGLKIPSVPDEPTKHDAEQAAQYILVELFCDFKFVNDGEESSASKANSFAALLTPFIREYIDAPAPMAAIDAPVAGTGKSLLSDIISIVATGRCGAMMGVPKSEEEMEKLLISKFLDGSTLCIFDNVNETLQSANLARAITSTTYKGRLLGTNVALDLPVQTSFVCNGNNLRFGGDIARRCYWIRIDSETGRPWERSGFKHPDLREWAFRNRGQLLSKILTMIRAWIVAGKPQSSSTSVIGSFEKWSTALGGILEYSGVSGFMKNSKKMYEQSDEEAGQWEEFLFELLRLYGKVSFTTRDIFERLLDDQELLHSLPFHLTEAYSTKQDTFTRKLGKAFNSIANRRFGEEEICVERGNGNDTRSKANRWCLKKKNPQV